ncbi:MAG TPA: DUF1648 domain-containing protein [Rhodoglobus sp.]|nr:DUF1648 domain-containing protein [Rhodoglobus sp.]
MTATVRTVLVAAIVPLLIAAAGVIAILIALPELPDPIAVHWNGSGPDGSGPVWVALLSVGLIPIAFSAFALAIARPGRGGFSSLNQRALAATSPFLAAVLAVAIGGSVVLQRGIADWRDAPGIGWLVVAGLAGGVLLAVAGWFVLPDVAPEDPAPAVEPMPLDAGRRAVWTQRIRPARSAVAVLVVAGAMVLGAAVLVWIVAPLAFAIGFTATMVLITVAVAGTLQWRVTAGEQGLRVRSLLGVPDYRVPLEEIAEVGVIEVDAMRQFGGWGVRWGGSRRWGVITRAGEAIEVRRTDGSRFVVSAPEAGEGAALLAALAGRRVG